MSDNTLLNAVLPEVRIFLLSDDKPEEIARYFGFTYPHIGEEVYITYETAEIVRVTHAILNFKPLISCYAVEIPSTLEARVQAEKKS